MPTKKQMAIEIATKDLLTKSKDELIYLISSNIIEFVEEWQVKMWYEDYFPKGDAKEVLNTLKNTRKENDNKENDDWLKARKKEFDDRMDGIDE